MVMKMIISDMILVYYRLDAQNDAPITACKTVVEGLTYASACFDRQDIFQDGRVSEVVAFLGSKLGLEIWMLFFSISCSILIQAFFATFCDSIQVTHSNYITVTHSNSVILTHSNFTILTHSNSIISTTTSQDSAQNLENPLHKEIPHSHYAHRNYLLASTSPLFSSSVGTNSPPLTHTLDYFSSCFRSGKVFLSAKDIFV